MSHDTDTAGTRRFRATAGRLARRLAVVTTAAALAVVVAPTAASATPALANTARTSSGASLSSSGYCGGSTFNFTVDSGGFEYLRIHVIDRSGLTSFDATAVNQTARFTYQLPFNVQYKSWIVEGFDWNPATASWDTALVVTSFLQVPALDYSTWYC